MLKKVVGLFLLSLLSVSPLFAQQTFRLKDYLSNRVGDEWQFQNYVTDGLSPIVIKTSQNVEFKGVKTVRRDENNGDYRLQLLTNEGLKIYRLYFIGDRFIDYEKPILLMPATVKIGATYNSESLYATSVKGAIKERGKQTYAVKIERRETVQTPLREFKDCLVVRTVALRVDDSGAQKGYEIVEWLAKDSGAVKVKGELFWKNAKGETTRSFKIDAALEKFQTKQ